MSRLVCPLDCPDTCAMTLAVEQGRAVKLAGDRVHPFTQGFLCHKMSRYLERVGHPERLTTPLRRIGAKGAGRFERISWDEALTVITNKLQTARASAAGPQSILPYSYCGTMGKLQGESLDRRFFHHLKATLLERTICATAGSAGYALTLGRRIGTDPEAIDEARYIINWGSNTAVTNSHLWVRMVAARKKHGAKIVTIDPYRSPTAQKSDWHLALRVGTDAALALGMMHILFRDRLLDDDYIARYTLGVEELRARVDRDYRPEQVAQITGLPVADIERLAAEYATTSPAFIRVNYGLQRHYGGGMAVRTIACLPALIGAWRHAAGGLLLSTSGAFPLNTGGLQQLDRVPRGTRAINMNQLAEALHGDLPGPPVQVLFVYNSNPAAVAPDQPRVLAGLQREDLFTVVHEHFLTDTADYADIVLPATMQPEHADLHTAYGHYYVQWNAPAISAPGECRSNTDLFRLLAERMNLPPADFAVSDEALARTALWEDAAEQPTALRGITLERLQQDGPQRLRLPKPYVPFAEGGFTTPSGRCEFYSPQLADRGEDPLPSYIPPAESPEAQPELAARYPLQLLSPPSSHFLNSTFVEVASLRDAAGGPTLEIHPDDAQPRGITSGCTVRIQNDRGTFHATAQVGPTVRPGVVVAPGIWWHKQTDGTGNANLTTSSRVTPWGGGATFFDNLVEVSLQP